MERFAKSEMKLEWKNNSKNGTETGKYFTT